MIDADAPVREAVSNGFMTSKSSALPTAAWLIWTMCSELKLLSDKHNRTSYLYNISQADPNEHASVKITSQRLCILFQTEGWRSAVPPVVITQVIYCIPIPGGGTEVPQPQPAGWSVLVA